MQTTMTMEGALRREFFTADREADIHREMDKRRDQLMARGETFVGRTKIGRNATCPCGTGLKFKKCCMAGARRVGTL